MRLELTRVGLLVELANHYTTRGALDQVGCVLAFVAVSQMLGLPSTRVLHLRPVLLETQGAVRPAVTEGQSLSPRAWVAPF